MSRASNRLEDAIEGEQTTEAALARLFEDNPHILLNLGYQKIISQPSLQPSDGGSLRPDFVLMPTSGKLCDILELRLPRGPLMTGTDQRRRFSTSVHHAINVLRHYEDHFKDPRHRQSSPKSTACSAIGRGCCYSPDGPNTQMNHSCGFAT